MLVSPHTYTVFPYVSNSGVYGPIQNNLLVKIDALTPDGQILQ